MIKLIGNKGEIFHYYLHSEGNYGIVSLEISNYFANPRLPTQRVLVILIYIQGREYDCQIDD